MKMAFTLWWFFVAALIVSRMLGELAEAFLPRDAIVEMRRLRAVQVAAKLDDSGLAWRLASVIAGAGYFCAVGVVLVYWWSRV